MPDKAIQQFQRKMVGAIVDMRDRSIPDWDLKIIEFASECGYCPEYDPSDDGVDLAIEADKAEEWLNDIISAPGFSFRWVGRDMDVWGYWPDGHLGELEAI